MHRSMLKLVGKMDKRSVRMDILPYDPYIDDCVKVLFPELYPELRMYKRSRPTMQLIDESIKKFDRPIIEFSSLGSDSKLYQEALLLAKKEFKLGSPVDIYRPIDVIPHLEKSSSSGYPHYQKKGDILDLIIEDSYKLKHQFETYDFWNLKHPPATYALRSHLSTRDKSKIRAVWNIPAHVLVIEGMFALPLLEAYAYRRSKIANYGNFNLRYLSIASKYSDNEYNKYNLDWSSFDSMIPEFIIRDVFDLLYDQVDWDRSFHYYFTPRQKEKNLNLWNNMVEYFINTSILMPNGELYRKQGGICSGSWFTQLVGSICNYILVRMLILKFAKKPADCYSEVYVLGDDSFFVSPKSVDFDLSEWQSWIKSRLNMDLNSAKCAKGKAEDVKFLGFKIAHHGIYKDPKDWLLMALYPEATELSPTMSFKRLVGIFITSRGYSLEIQKLYNYFINRYQVNDELLVNSCSRSLERFVKIITGKNLTQICVGGIRRSTFVGL